MRILHLFLRVSTFSRKMKNVEKQAAVVILIAFHICASFFMQYSHQHILYGSADGHQTVQDHSRGAIATQRTLDECRHCLLCLRNSTSNAILELSFFVPGACVQPIVIQKSSGPSLSGRTSRNLTEGHRPSLHKRDSSLDLLHIEFTGQSFFK